MRLRLLNTVRSPVARRRGAIVRVAAMLVVCLVVVQAAQPGARGAAAAGAVTRRATLPMVASDGLPPPSVSYTVQTGDNLWAIGLRFGTTAASIVALNGLRNANDIAPGQSIVVLPVGPAPPAPTPPASARVVTQGTGNIVAFSFDAGSDVGYTAMILDTLAHNGITASFGMTGAWAEQNPALLKRIVAEGHHLINHTYSHPDFTTISTSRRWQELDRTNDIVIGLTGIGMKPFFRPPFGAYNAAVNADIATDGYWLNIYWTVDSLGWNGLSASEIIARCLSRAAPGAIYLFHVGSQSQDGPALQAMIDGLRAAGYRIGSVPDVLGQ